MRTQRFGSWAVILLIIGGCASTASPPTPTSNVPVSESAANAAGPGAPGPAAKGPGNERVRALVELDSMRRELAQLRDKVEVQENELEKMRKRQRELYDDLDYRLRARERSAGGRPVPPSPAMAPPAEAEPPAPGMPAMATETPSPAPGTGAMVPPGPAAPEAGPTAGPADLPMPPVSQPVTPTTEVAAPVAPTQLAVANAAEQASYDSAFEMLKQGRYGEAIAAFENILAQYPNGALADDSQYWIGEAWYVTRDYERALDIFKQVVDRFPDSPRVPEALLKIGYVQNEVGAKGEACRTFARVINQYPGSRVAISAQTRRKRLELDGHCPS